MAGMELYHYGIKQRSGRYPWGSGKRPYQSEEEKAEKKKQNSAKRKETLKKVGAAAYKAAWTGIAVALKVVASSAITSMTLAGVAAAGFQFIQSPACQSLMSQIGISAGRILYRNFVEPAATQTAKDLDGLLGQALGSVATQPIDYSKTVDKMFAGTKYLGHLDFGDIPIDSILKGVAT